MPAMKETPKEPSKETEKKEPDFKIIEGDFREGFSDESIKRASSIEVLPKLDLKFLVDRGPLTVTMISEPRKVQSAKLPKGEAWFIDVLYQDIKHSMVLPDSLRFSLVTLRTREKWSNFSNHKIVITAGIATIRTPKFQGQAKTYRATPIL